MAMAPQMHTHAPSEPWKYFQKLTVPALSSADPAKLVCSTCHPHATPLTTPPRYMAMCGYDQNVSRPMVWCHEMSHSTPMMTLVDANSTASTCQGTDAASARAASCACARAGGFRRVGAEAIGESAGHGVEPGRHPVGGRAGEGGVALGFGDADQLNEE